MNQKLILNKLTSPFVFPHNDLTSGNVLSQNDLDNNFIYLKGETIYSGETVGGILNLNKLNGENIKIDISALNTQKIDLNALNSEVITGGTHNKKTGITTFTDSNNCTLNVTGYFNTDDDIHIIGGTHNKVKGITTLTNSDGSLVNITGYSNSSDEIHVTGGTYNSSTGVATFTNNIGGVFTVSGFLSENKIELVDNLISGGSDKALTGEQGKVLKGLLDKNTFDLNTKITNLTDKSKNLENILGDNKTDRQYIDKVKTGLQNQIEDETLRSKNNEADLQIALDNEIKRATGIEGNLLTNKEDKANKGIANGYTPLDNLKKVSAEYLNLVDNLTTGGNTSILTAQQGKVLQNQINAINVILSSNDVNFDTVQEIVDGIKIIQTTLATMLVNDLTTGGTTKALTAEQGKVLKITLDAAIDTLNTSITTEFNRATGVEGQLTTAINTERDRAIGIESNLQIKKQNISEKGQANGYTPLDTVKKVSAEFLNIIDNLTTGGNTNILSAQQGKILKELIDTAISDFTVAINAENLRASTAETNLTKAINTEIDRAKGVENKKEDTDKKGQPGGYTPLDGSGKVSPGFLNIIDNLTTGGNTNILSAQQGKELNDNALHKTGNETKRGELTVDKIITNGGTSNQYVKGDGSLATLSIAVSDIPDIPNKQKTITESYTITDGDNNTSILINNGANDITITVPTGLMDKIQVGFIQQGTGVVTFGVNGTLLYSPLGTKIKGQYYNAYLEQINKSNSYQLLGSLKT